MQFVSQICTREGTLLSERVENLEGNGCYQKKKKSTWQPSPMTLLATPKEASRHEPFVSRFYSDYVVPMRPSFQRT